VEVSCVQILTSGGKEHLLGVVGQPEPGRRLSVGERLDPVEEVVPAGAVGHHDVSLAVGAARHAVHVGHQREVALEARRREQLRQERRQEPLVEVVVDLAAVDALGHQCHQRIPRHLFWGKVCATLRHETTHQSKQNITSKILHFFINERRE